MVDKISLHNVSAQSLRANFKSISSGQKVSAKEETSSTASSSQDSQRVSALISNLNDAVRYSSSALNSLGKVQELSHPEDEFVNIDDLSKGIDKLKEDLSGVMDVLQNHANTAEVIQENLQSSVAKISDVDAATSHAQATGSLIKSASAEALGAHGSINATNVASLLNE